MKIYLAGADGGSIYIEALKRAGVKNRLESFYSLGGRPSMHLSMFDYLLDSGGFVARTKGVPIKIEEYARYINQNKIQKAFNLDTKSVKETLANQKYLDANCPDCYIIPVYHISDYLEGNVQLFKDYIASYSYIGIGGVAKVGYANQTIRDRAMEYIFSLSGSTTALHGLGQTMIEELRKYPWYSVDSTSWLQPARYGGSKFHSKNMGRVRSKVVPYDKNAEREAMYWVKKERELTYLWKQRGIDWEDFELKRFD